MEHAHTQWLSLLTLGLLLLAVAIYGWRSAAEAAVNRSFAIQTLVVTWWVIGIAGAHSAHIGEFWGRWTFAAAALMPAAFVRFVEVFPTREQAPSRFISLCIQVTAFSFAVVSLLSPWVAHTFVMTNGVLTRSAGPLMSGFAVFFIASAAVIFLSLTRKLRWTRGLARAQTRLYYFGLLFFCIGALTTNLLMPAIVNDSRYSSLGPVFVLVFLAFVAHGIIRHRLMNVRLIIHNWLTILVASLVSIVPLSAVLLRMTANDSAGPIQRSSIAMLVVAGLLAAPVWIATRHLVQQYVYRGDADFRTLVSSASTQLSNVVAPKQTASIVISTILDAVRPEGVAIYLASASGAGALTLLHSRSRDTFGLPNELPGSVAMELATARMLASLRSVAAEVKGRLSDSLAETLAANHWAFLLPLAAETELIGAIAVGEKLSGDPYYAEDVGLLEVLASQATVAFSNGKLYERVLLANQHIENIVATVQSGIVVAYDQHSLRLLNDEAVRLLGLASAVPRPITISIRDVPEALVDILIQTWATGRPTQAVELADLPVLCSTAPLRTADGAIVGVVGALNDLSTLKALDVERRRAERLNYFEALAAGLAHEIANPIAPIKIMTQLLPSRSHDEAFIRTFSRTVTREIERMEMLVERLRELSRPASRERVPVDLRNAVTETVQVMQTSFDERHVSVVLQLCKTPLVVAGDVHELHQLFLNLLKNAVEATPKDGRVVIEASAEDAAAIVRVADSGTGIPPSMIDRIFEPFVSSKQRGSGLGLVICNGIVQHHKGTITGYNNDDRGASFVVRIPLLRV